MKMMKEQMDKIAEKLKNRGYFETHVEPAGEELEFLRSKGYPESFLRWLRVCNSDCDMNGDLRLKDTKELIGYFDREYEHYEMLIVNGYLPFASDVSGDTFVFDTKNDCRIRLADHDSGLEKDSKYVAGYIEKECLDDRNFPDITELIGYLLDGQDLLDGYRAKALECMTKEDYLGVIDVVDEGYKKLSVLDEAYDHEHFAWWLNDYRKVLFENRIQSLEKNEMWEDLAEIWKYYEAYSSKSKNGKNSYFGAMNLFVLDDFEEADKFLREAKWDGWIYLARALNSIKLGKKDEASADLDTLIRRDESVAPEAEYLKRILEDGKPVDPIIRDWRKAFFPEPDEDRIHIAFLETLLKQGDFEWACELSTQFPSGRRSSGLKPIHKYLQTLALRLSGHIAESEKAAAEFRDLKDDIRRYYDCGSLLDKIGADEEIKGYFRTLGDLFNDADKR